MVKQLYGLSILSKFAFSVEILKKLNFCGFPSLHCQVLNRCKWVRSGVVNAFSAKSCRHKQQQQKKIQTQTHDNATTTQTQQYQHQNIIQQQKYKHAHTMQQQPRHNNINIKI